VRLSCQLPNLASQTSWLQVLIGDPMQLEAHSEFFNTHLPSSQDGLRDAMEHHSRSAMQRLALLWASKKIDKRLSVRLKTQYRMHESICYLIDANFYGKNRVRERLLRMCPTVSSLLHVTPSLHCRSTPDALPDSGLVV
jgi:hypothetical protein